MRLRGAIMHNTIKLIALDLDGTLLNNSKELTARNYAALERAAAEGIWIVPTTGRFYGAMPEAIRNLPFVRYVITINGAEVVDTQTGNVLSRACIPWQQALEIMRALDDMPVIYDCFMGNAAYMSEALKAKIDDTITDIHYLKMLHELRQSVPELKAYLAQRQQDVQKIQFFTKYPDFRLRMLSELQGRWENVCVSTSVVNNVEFNNTHANKGEALLALAQHLGIAREGVMGFGDGLNDLSMIEMAGVGVAMANACTELKEAADYVTTSCDEDGVARGVEKFCFGA